MARIGLLHHVHSQEAECVDTQFIECRVERKLLQVLSKQSWLRRALLVVGESSLVCGMEDPRQRQDSIRARLSAPLLGMPGAGIGTPVR